MGPIHGLGPIFMQGQQYHVCIQLSRNAPRISKSLAVSIQHVPEMRDARDHWDKWTCTALIMGGFLKSMLWVIHMLCAATTMQLGSPNQEIQFRKDVG